MWALPVIGVALLLVYVTGPYRLCLRIVHDVQARNAQALARDVDFERIRSAIKIRMTECFTQHETLRKNPFGGLALALVNPMVDNLLIR